MKGGRPKTDAKPLDDSKTKPSTRGTLLPYILGTKRIGGIFAALGRKGTRKVENASGGGGREEVKKKTYTTVYYEEGVHMLSLGIGRRLTVCSSKQKVVTIERATTPSGSKVSAGSEGSFWVYWGRGRSASEP